MEVSGGKKDVNVLTGYRLLATMHNKTLLYLDNHLMILSVVTASVVIDYPPSFVFAVPKTRNWT